MGSSDAFLAKYELIDSFSIYSPTDWSTDIAPKVIGQFYIERNGVDVSSVQYAYSTTGSSTPTNWMAVDGVYEDAACTDPAEDGDTGWLYVVINSVPFNQESDTQNTIRFRASDTTKNLGIQSNAIVIRIDTSTTSSVFLPLVNLETSLPILLILIIVLSIIGVVSIGVVYKFKMAPPRSSSEDEFKITKEEQEIPRSKDLTVKEIKTIKSPFTDRMSLTDKIKVLSENMIPIEMMPEFQDEQLKEYFNQNFTALPLAVKEKITSLDISSEEKLQILKEFTSISEKYQNKFLKILDEE